MPSPSVPSPALQTFLDAVADKARAADAFASVEVHPGLLSAAAKASAQPADYRLMIEDGALWVALLTADRWLSQSIEADLVHTGDKLNELIHEELVNLGWEGFVPTFEHFRDQKKLYTFRTRLTPPLDHSRLGSPESIDKAALALLAYEAAFRPLGDMAADDDE